MWKAGSQRRTCWLSCGLQISLPQGLLSTSSGEAAPACSTVCSLGLSGSTSGTRELQGAGLAPPRAHCAHTWPVASTSPGLQPGWLSRSAHGSTARCGGTLGLGTREKQLTGTWSSTGISVLPQWHSTAREDFPHQLQSQQEPGLDLLVLSALNTFEIFSFSP